MLHVFKLNPAQKHVRLVWNIRMPVSVLAQVVAFGTFIRLNLHHLQIKVRSALTEPLISSA